MIVTVGRILKLNWLRLNATGKSLISKAMLTLSLASFVIANLDIQLMGLRIASWGIQAAFVGALLFVVGWGLVSFKCPVELKGETDSDTVASAMADAGAGIFPDRVIMLRKLICRYRARPPFDLPENLLGAADAACKLVGPTPTWDRDKALHLYRYDVQLRSYDRPCDRIMAAVLLSTGLTLMFLSTASNILKALFALS